MIAVLISASLLFCYDPQVEVSRDGRPRKHYAMTHGKNYQQMFNTLLHEVPVQTLEWHRLSLMPQAWNSFMERLFGAMLQVIQDTDLDNEHFNLKKRESSPPTESLCCVLEKDTLSYDVASVSEITPCIKVNKPLVVYRFLGKVMK